MTTAYVGLGANLGDRRATIEEALRRLAGDPAIAVTATSSLRENDPVGHTASHGCKSMNAPSS